MTADSGTAPGTVGAAAGGHDVVTVEFTSSDAGGSAPLSWAQQHIWDVMCWLDDDDPYFNIPWTLPVEPAATLHQVLTALRTLIELHDALRTTFVGRGAQATQHIRPTGSVQVQLRPAAGEDPLDAQALALAVELTAKAFDHGQEPPLRCALLLSDGRPAYACFALSHAAIDAWSLRVLKQQWHAMLQGEQPPARCTQPRDRARYEAEEGAVRGAQSLKYWRNTLAKAPTTLFPKPLAEPEEQRFIRVHLESDALAVAALQLAKQCSVSTVSVLTVVCAALAAGYSGNDRVAMQLIVANRHDAKFRDMVGPASQDGLFLLNIGEASVLEVFQRGHIQALACYRYGHYAPSELRALRAEARAGQEGPVDLSVYFNDVRDEGTWHGLPEHATPEQYAHMLAESRTQFLGSFDKVDAKAFFALGPSMKTGELTLTADTAYVPRKAAYALLHAAERLLVNATADTSVGLAALVAACGVSPLGTGPKGGTSEPGSA
jgi:hypothetical protein